MKLIYERGAVVIHSHQHEGRPWDRFASGADHVSAYSIFGMLQNENRRHHVHFIQRREVLTMRRTSRADVPLSHVRRVERKEAAPVSCGGFRPGPPLLLRLIPVSVEHFCVLYAN